MKRKCKIIFAAQDAGGFDALLPVFQLIKKKRNYKVFLFLAGKSRKTAESLKIKYINADNFSIQDVEKIIEKEHPNLIFTATSFGFSIEKRFILSAKKKNVLAISIVDFWSNCKIRFGDNLEYLPNYILAVDEKMKKEMITEGISESRIFITGNPRFDRFSNIKGSKGNNDTTVFYSQPFSELSDKRLNEIEIFKDIVKALEKIYPQKEIIVKFHPAENNKNKFGEIIKNTDLKIKIEKKLETYDLNKKAGLIMGINSMVLFDAALMGKKVLSYQPGEKKENDVLQSNVYGWSVPVYKKTELLPKIKNILKEKFPTGGEQRTKYTKNKSTEKVINFIEGILKRKKIICVIQARTGSTRLPRKVLLDLEGKPVLLRVVDRILESKKIDQIVVATTDKKRDETIVRLIKGYNSKVGIFQGSENDCLDRYYKAVKKYNPDAILRITADCPLIDPEVVDKVVDAFLDFNGDYVTNTLGKRTYPRGLDAEVFSFKILEKMWKDVKGELYRDNLTLFIRKNPDLFKCKNVINPIDYSFHRWTLDEEDDYKLIKIIYQQLYKKNPNFRMKDILELFDKNPDLIKINQYVEQKNPHY